MTLGMGGLPRMFLWKNVTTFGGSQEMFCKVCGPHFDISGDVDTAVMFQKFFDLTVMHDIAYRATRNICNSC